MFNLTISLEDSSRRFATKEAIICGPKRLTFSALNDEANKVANALTERGLKKGDKVALTCPNVHYFPVIYYGILKAGGVVVPLSILLKKEEIKYHLEASDARIYFAFEGSEQLPIGEECIRGFQEVEKCEQLILIPASNVKNYSETYLQDFIADNNVFETVQTSAEDTAVIIFTSGTTGKSKGAALTHSNLAWNAALCRHLFLFDTKDKALTVLPMFHIFGQTCLLNACIMHGISNVIIPRFEPELILQAMQAEEVSIFAGVPTMYWALLNYVKGKHTVDFNKIKMNLRLCVSGGASLPVQVLEDFEATFEQNIYEGYGMSEGSPVVTFNHPGQTRKAGSIGIPVWGVEVKLVDKEGSEVTQGEKGELLYRGHNVMKGYYKKEKETSQALTDGWLHSGDIATQDEEGYYYIVDRTKDMILRGGLNVYPREIEEVMIQHEAVSIVAVIGVPCAKYGEEIKACIVLNEGADISESELQNWVKERVASYKYPRKFEFMDALPMSATGKILKRSLRKLEV